MDRLPLDGQVSLEGMGVASGVECEACLVFGDLCWLAELVGSGHFLSLILKNTVVVSLNSSPEIQLSLGGKSPTYFPCVLDTFHLLCPVGTGVISVITDVFSTFNHCPFLPVSTLHQ